jgi:hypothetical protein
MTSALDRTVQKLGDGAIVSLDSGRRAFKLDSWENNPIAKPQDLGLTWYATPSQNLRTLVSPGTRTESSRSERSSTVVPRCSRARSC